MKSKSHTLDKVTIDNVVCSNILIDKRCKDEICIASFRLIADNIPGHYAEIHARLLQIMYTFVTDNIPCILQTGNAYVGLISNIDPKYRIVLNKPFLPDLRVADRYLTAIQAGKHNPAIVVDLESSCTCVCSFTFHNVVLTRESFRNIDVVKISWESLTFQVTSDITVDDIEIISGCPNYG